jgi:hypothetical protein
MLAETVITRCRGLEASKNGPAESGPHRRGDGGDGGIFRGLTRRGFMAGAGAAAVGAGSLVLPARRGWARERKSFTPGRKLFNDIELTYFQDNNWLHAPLWLSPTFMKDAGVGIKSRELYEGGDTVAKILPQLLSRRPRFDWMQFPSLFFGAFAEAGQLKPLDDYFAQYEGNREYLD